MYVKQAVLDVYNVCIAGSTGCVECKAGSTGGVQSMYSRQYWMCRM